MLSHELEFWKATKKREWIFTDEVSVIKNKDTLTIGPLSKEAKRQTGR